MSNQQQQLSVEGFPQSEIDSLFHEIAHVGAFKFFSELRDRAIAAGNELQKLAATMTEDEKTAIRTKAIELRNDVIIYQTATDAAYKFDQITSSAGFTKN